MLKIAFKKIINNKSLMLSLFAGVLIAIIISCTIPMYSRAISHRMLVTQLENYQEANNVSPSSVVVSCSLSAFTRRDEKSTNFDNFKYCDNYLHNDFYKKLYMPPLVKSTTLSCATMYAIDNRDKKESTLSKIVLKATDNYQNAVNLISGRMPKNIVDENGCIEVMISRAMHTDSKYTIGTILDIAYSTEDLKIRFEIPALLKAKIVGIFDYVSDPYSPFIDKDSGNELYCNYQTYFDYVFEQKNLCLNATWYYAGDFTKYDFNKIEQTIDAIKKFNNNIVVWGLSSNAKTITPPIAQYETYFSNIKSINVLLILFYSPVLILIIYFIFIISKFVVENDKNEISMLTSRGASKKQILYLYLLQGGIIAVIGIICAPLLSLVLCNILGTTSGFLEFAQRAPLKINLSFNSISFCLIAAFLSLVTMLVPVFKASKLEIVEQKRKKSNKIIETIILIACTVVTGIISIYSYYNLVIEKEGLFTVKGSVQPLAYIFLICIFAFTALLFVLIYPLIINLFFKAGNKKWQTAKFTAFSRMRNMAIKEKFIIIFLTLTIAIGTFSSVCARTLNYNIDNSSKYNYPCDIIADVNFYTAQGSENLNRRFLFNDIEGIEATRVIRGTNPRLNNKSGNSISKNLNMLAINPNEYGKIVDCDDRILSEPLSNYLNILENDINSCIISKNVADVLRVKENDILYLKPNSELKNNVVTPVYVKKIVEAWPTYNPKVKDSFDLTNDNYLIVVNINAIDKIAPNQPYSVWMNTDKSVSELKLLTVKLAANADKYEDKASARLINIINGAREKYLGQINPIRQATNGSLTLGFISVIVICMIGFVIYWMISIKSRILQIGTMRALGVTFREVYEMILWEQLLICLASVVIGIISGFVTGYLFAPLLQSAFGTMGQMPPYQFAFEFNDFFKLIILVLLLISVSLTTAIIMLKNIKASTAIKLGEE